MLSRDLETELTARDKVILESYLNHVAQLIQKNLKEKDISGYGASYSSGRSYDSFENRETHNGMQLWGADYLYELEYPLSPSEQQSKNYQTQWAGIRDWIDQKPIFFEGDISANTLAGMITKEIREHGTGSFKKYGGGPTGIVTEAIRDEDIDELINDLGLDKLESITEFLMHEF